MSVLPITIFSDFFCPASYVMESSLRSLGDAKLEIRYRACDLLSDSGRPVAPSFGDSEWEALEELAIDLGISIGRRTATGRSQKAHEAAIFARDRGSEAKLREVIFDAFWSKGEDISRIDLLVSLGGKVGIDPEDLRIALDIDTHSEQVAADRELAMRLRIPGTPVIYIGTGKDARIVVGTRKSEELRQLIEEVSNRDTD